jgi:hypothetical protein
MARKSWVQINGVLYDKDEPLPQEALEAMRSGPRGPSIMPDLPDVVSPIDGSIIRGRAGLRDHCARHNVVPTEELKGLPTKRSVTEYVPDRAAIREEIRRQVYK